MTYYSKLNKYNQKINQLGGLTKEQLETKIIPRRPRCPTTHFSQHLGECWNDAIQMLFCYSDAIKQTVQNKLLNLESKEIIDFAYYNGREICIPPIYRRYNNYDIAPELENKLIQYLNLLQRRLCMHLNIDTDVCKITEEIKTCIDADYDRIFAETSYKEPYTRYKYESTRLHRQSSLTSGVMSAIIGTQMVDDTHSISYHGATLQIGQNIINNLSFCLLDNKFIKIHYKTISNMTEYDIDSCFGIYIASHGMNRDEYRGHATAFYTCNDQDLYYDDNLYKRDAKIKYIVDWRLLLKKCINEGCIFYLDFSSAIIYYNFQSNLTIYYKIQLNGISIRCEKPSNLWKISHMLFLKLDDTFTIDEQITIYKKYPHFIRDETLEIYPIVLHDALISKDNELIMKILNERMNISVDAKDINGINILGNAIINNSSYDIINLLLEKFRINVNSTDNNGISILAHAIINRCDITIINLLISNRAYVNNTDNNGISILAHAIISRCDITIINLLIRNRAYVNNTDNNKLSVLAYAIIYKSDISILELLLNSGANVNILDKYNNNILQIAIQLESDDLIIYLLVSHGADYLYKGSSLYSPFKQAVINQNIKYIRIYYDKAYSEKASSKKIVEMDTIVKYYSKK
jgi:ankyrin repeat protein